MRSYRWLRLSHDRQTPLYEEDFPLWAERQGALLRARRFEELDLDNLIEEVEALARREGGRWRAVPSSS